MFSSYPYLLIVLLLIFLVIISVQDILKGIIPNAFVGGVALLGLFYGGIETLLSAVILVGIGYGLYKLYPLVRSREGLGFGDVKLMGASGLWLLPAQIPFFLILTGLGGILMAILWKMLKKGPKFPLGPALAFALGICIVGGQNFLQGETKMNATFSGPSFGPASGGKPDSIVVLIHGYGSDGEDLLSLGKSWGSLLPNTLFVAPHGPVACEMNPSGNQWFGLKDWEPLRILKEIQALTPAFNRYLDGLLKFHNLPSNKLALVGFSQGAMLALHVALHRPQSAGVVAYSGAFLNDPMELKVARPPVLLIHGTEDQVLPASASQTAEEALKALSVPVILSLLSGLGHGIDSRGLGMGGAFLKEKFHENDASGLSEEVKESNNYKE
ncbi:prepilin peptidase [Kamptonema cortianum]|jgi:phospholipase/carboxylesterase|nr:prepilin peptidase [Kamptonema cortianum]